MQLKDKTKSVTLYAYSAYNMLPQYVYSLSHVPFVWRWGSCKSIKVWNIANACRERSLLQRVAMCLAAAARCKQYWSVFATPCTLLVAPHSQASTDTATSRAIQTNKLTLHFHTTLANMQRLCPSFNPFPPSFLSLIQLAMHKYISFQVEHETRHGQGRDYIYDVTQVLRDFCRFIY